MSIRTEIMNLPARTVENIDQILSKKYDIHDVKNPVIRMFNCVKAEHLFDLDKRRIASGFLVTALVVGLIGAMILLMFGISMIGRYYLWNEIPSLGSIHALTAGSICTVLGGAALGLSIYQIKKLDRRQLTDEEIDRLLSNITIQMENEMNRFKDNLATLRGQESA